MRWIFRLLGLVVVLIALAVGALFLLPADRIAQLAARQFEAATGRQLTIAGGVTPTFWPVLGARVEGVTLANAPGAQGGPMLVADSVDLGVDLSALWGGSVVVRRFEARNPQIVLERDANGQGNWVFSGLGATQDTTVSDSGAGVLPPISLDRAQIEGASLRFIDHQAGTDVTVQGVTLDLSMPEAGGAATLTLNVANNGQQATVRATLGSVEQLLAGQVVPVTAAIEASGAQGTFDGRMGVQPVAAEGRIALDIRQLAPLLALAGAGGAEVLPDAARPLSLAGQFTLAPAGSIHLRDGALGVGVNRLALALDTTFDGPRPQVSGTISADSLDLSGFTSGNGASNGGGAAAAGAGWPTNRIDASALGIADAQIGLTLGPVNTGYGTLDSLRGSLTIERSRGVLTISELRGFDGTGSGELVANNRNGLSVGGNLSLQGVSLLSALRQSLGFERLSGTASANLRFLGVGNSVDAIMRSLEGQGQIRFGRGEILGFDLSSMLRNLDPSAIGAGNSTIYDSIGASFTMNGGVLTNQDLALEASLLAVRGQGTVDLGNQTLDYRVTPEAMRNADTGEALRVPLLITGPWSEPRFRLDLEGLAEQRLREEQDRLRARAEEEAQRLEDQARARVQDAVQQQLGVTQQEGQSAEDALRQGVEDRAREGLLRLLGGGGGQAEAPAAGN